MAGTKTRTKSSRSDSTIKVERTSAGDSGMNFDFQNNRSVINLVLGAAVLIVLAVVIYNFFSNQKASNPGDLGPSQQVDNTQPPSDVAKENLPGKYTVKEGDTLFLIAQKYYNNGDQYNQIVTANKLADENSITVGQVLDIPKLPENLALASPASSVTPAATAAPTPEPAATPAPSDLSMPGMDVSQTNPNLGTGGDPNQTIWGPKITGNTYTVQIGDWLSKIAGRAYGDITSYLKIAQANNIANPDLIEPAMVLKIPR